MHAHSQSSESEGNAQHDVQSFSQVALEDGEAGLWDRGPLILIGTQITTQSWSCLAHMVTVWY